MRLVLSIKAKELLEAKKIEELQALPIIELLDDDSYNRLDSAIAASLQSGKLCDMNIVDPVVVSNGNIFSKTRIDALLYKVSTGSVDFNCPETDEPLSINCFGPTNDSYVRLPKLNERLNEVVRRLAPPLPEYSPCIPGSAAARAQPTFAAGSPQVSATGIGLFSGPGVSRHPATPPPLQDHNVLKFKRT